MTQPLYAYQARAIAETRQAYRDGRRAILLVAPTGAGKTRIGVEFAGGSLAKGGHVLWLAHREELIDQAVKRLEAEGVPRVGIIANDRPTINAPIQVASLQTLAARAAKGLPSADLVVFDEAHHGKAKSYEAVVNGIRTRRGEIPVRIGLTATPERGDGKPMGDVFDHVVSVSSVRELQALGVLVPCLTYAPSTRTKQLSQHPVAAYLARTPGERAFVFAVNVAHAERLALEFETQGVRAATIHTDTPWILRRARLAAFQTQDTRPLREAGSLEPAPLVLCNVYTLTEGVDVPEASCCILARGCGHAGLFLQMVGRVLRAAPWAGKTRATLIDLRGAVHRLGLPEQDRAWSLDGKAISLAENEREVKLRVCPACGGAFATYAVDRRDGARCCPLCREKIAPPEAPTVSPRELHQMGAAAAPEAKSKVLAQLATVAARKGYKAGWAAVRYKDRFGAWPARHEAASAYREAVEQVGALEVSEALAARALARHERQQREAENVAAGRVADEDDPADVADEAQANYEAARAEAANCG